MAITLSVEIEPTNICPKKASDAIRFWKFDRFFTQMRCSFFGMDL